MSDSLAALTGGGRIDLAGRPEPRPADLGQPGRPGGVRSRRRGNDEPDNFAWGITEGGAYDEQLRDLATRRVSVGEALQALTMFDVRWACDVLRPVYDATGGVDGRVSIEVDPRLAHDTGATIAEARALWWAVDRPNLFIKVPAARQGLPALAACFSSSRWKDLQAAGARPQRPLWASTSVKDPAYPDTRYVVELVAPGMVNTMPEATLRLVADHGQVPPDSIHGHYDQSQGALDGLRELAIDYVDVVQSLEDDDVAKFDASWDQLGDRLASTMRSLSARH